MDISSIYLLYKRCIYLHMIIYWMDLDGNVISSPSCPKLLLCGSWWFQSLVSITRLGLMICHFSSYFSSTTHVAKSIKIPIVLKILDEITIFIVSSLCLFHKSTLPLLFRSDFSGTRQPRLRIWVSQRLWSSNSRESSVAGHRARELELGPIRQHSWHNLSEPLYTTLVII